jgi:hypothetical protein
VRGGGESGGGTTGKVRIGGSMEDAIAWDVSVCKAIKIDRAEMNENKRIFAEGWRRLRGCVGERGSGSRELSESVQTRVVGGCESRRGLPTAECGVKLYQSIL